MNILLTTKRDPRVELPPAHLRYVLAEGVGLVTGQERAEYVRRDPDSYSWWAELPKPASRAELLRALEELGGPNDED